MYKIFFFFILIVVLFSCDRKEARNSKTKNSMLHTQEIKNDSCFYVDIKDSVIINVIKQFSKEYNLKDEFVCLSIFENAYQYEIIISYVPSNVNISANYYTFFDGHKVIIEFGSLLLNILSYKTNMINELKKKVPSINLNFTISGHFPVWKLILCKEYEKYKLIRNSFYEKEYFSLFTDTLCYFKIDINKFLPDTTPPKKINIDSVVSLHSKR